MLLNIGSLYHQLIFNHKQTFQNSSLWKWPRRSCEALLYSSTTGLPAEPFPFPNSDNLEDLQNYITNILENESD